MRKRPSLAEIADRIEAEWYSAPRIKDLAKKFARDPLKRHTDKVKSQVKDSGPRAAETAGDLTDTALGGADDQ